jgi:hypothetical protein
VLQIRKWELGKAKHLSAPICIQKGTSQKTLIFSFSCTGFSVDRFERWKECGTSKSTLPVSTSPRVRKSTEVSGWLGTGRCLSMGPPNTKQGFVVPLSRHEILVTYLSVSRKRFNHSLLTIQLHPSQGRYLTQTLNTDRHPCLEWDLNPRSQRSSERRQFMP